MKQHSSQADWEAATLEVNETQRSSAIKRTSLRGGKYHREVAGLQAVS